MLEGSGRTKTRWFRLFGKKIVGAAIVASLAPAVYSMWLWKQSDKIAASALGIVWVALFTPLVVTLHRRRMARLGFCIAGTVIILAVFAFVFAATA